MMFPGRIPHVLSPHTDPVLPESLPVQLPRGGHSQDMDVSLRLQGEVALLVPLSDGQHGLAPVLQVQVSHGDEGDEVASLGSLGYL